MYHRILPTEKKEQILTTFSRTDSKLRLVIATTAFGLGVDCPDIGQVIHWGLPNTVEESMSRKVVGVVEMEGLQRQFCIREKLDFIALNS